MSLSWTKMEDQPKEDQKNLCVSQRQDEMPLERDKEDISLSMGNSRQSSNSSIHENKLNEKRTLRGCDGEHLNHSHNLDHPKNPDIVKRPEENKDLQADIPNKDKRSFHDRRDSRRELECTDYRRIHSSRSYSPRVGTAGHSCSSRDSQSRSRSRSNNSTWDYDRIKNRSPRRKSSSESDSVALIVRSPPISRDVQIRRGGSRSSQNSQSRSRSISNNSIRDDDRIKNRSTQRKYSYESDSVVVGRPPKIRDFKIRRACSCSSNDSQRRSRSSSNNSTCGDGRIKNRSPQQKRRCEPDRGVVIVKKTRYYQRRRQRSHRSKDSQSRNRSSSNISSCDEIGIKNISPQRKSSSESDSDSDHRNGHSQKINKSRSYDSKSISSADRSHRIYEQHQINLSSRQIRTDGIKNQERTSRSRSYDNRDDMILGTRGTSSINEKNSGFPVRTDSNDRKYPSQKRGSGSPPSNDSSICALEMYQRKSANSDELMKKTLKSSFGEAIGDKQLDHDSGTKLERDKSQERKYKSLSDSYLSDEDRESIRNRRNRASRSNSESRSIRECRRTSRSYDRKSNDRRYLTRRDINRNLRRSRSSDYNDDGIFGKGNERNGNDRRRTRPRQTSRKCNINGSRSDHSDGDISDNRKQSRSRSNHKNGSRCRRNDDDSDSDGDVRDNREQSRPRSYHRNDSRCNINRRRKNESKDTNRDRIERRGSRNRCAERNNNHIVIGKSRHLPRKSSSNINEGRICINRSRNTHSQSKERSASNHDRGGIAGKRSSSRRSQRSSPSNSSFDRSSSTCSSNSTNNNDVGRGRRRSRSKSSRRNEKSDGSSNIRCRRNSSSNNSQYRSGSICSSSTQNNSTNNNDAGTPTWGSGSKSSQRNTSSNSSLDRSSSTCSSNSTNNNDVGRGRRRSRSRSSRRNNSSDRSYERIGNSCCSNTCSYRSTNSSRDRSDSSRISNIHSQRNSSANSNHGGIGRRSRSSKRSQRNVKNGGFVRNHSNDRYHQRNNSSNCNNGRIGRSRARNTRSQSSSSKSRESFNSSNQGIIARSRSRNSRSERRSSRSSERFNNSNHGRIGRSHSRTNRSKRSSSRSRERFNTSNHGRISRSRTRNSRFRRSSSKSRERFNNSNRGRIDRSGTRNIRSQRSCSRSRERFNNTNNGRISRSRTRYSRSQRSSHRSRERFNNCRSNPGRIKSYCKKSRSRSIHRKSSSSYRSRSRDCHSDKKDPKINKYHQRKTSHNEGFGKSSQKIKTRNSESAKPKATAVPYTTIMIKKLPPHITTINIVNELITTGYTPYDVRLIKSKKGRSRGFAFIEYSTIHEAIKFMEGHKGVLMLQNKFKIPMKYSSPMKLYLSKRLTAPKDWFCTTCGTNNFKKREICFSCSSPKIKNQTRGDGNGEISSCTTKTIMLRNLDIVSTVETVLENLQSLIPENIEKVIAAEIGEDSVTSKSRGICYLGTNSDTDSLKVFNALNNLSPPLHIDGKRIFISYCKYHMGDHNQPYFKYKIRDRQADKNKDEINQMDATNSAAALAQFAIQLRQATKALEKGYMMPDVSKFIYDTNSGLYFDAQTGFYYDDKSGYFWSSALQKYLYWDYQKSTYALAPTGADNPDSSQVAVDEDVPNKKAKLAKKDKGQKIEKDMDKWLKETLNRKHVVVDPKREPVVEEKSGSENVAFSKSMPNINTSPELQMAHQKKNSSDDDGENIAHLQFLDFDNTSCAKLSDSDSVKKHAEKSEEHKQNLNKSSVNIEDENNNYIENKSSKSKGRNRIKFSLPKKQSLGLKKLENNKALRKVKEKVGIDSRLSKGHNIITNRNNTLYKNDQPNLNPSNRVPSPEKNRKDSYIKLLNLDNDCFSAECLNNNNVKEQISTSLKANISKTSSKFSKTKTVHSQKQKVLKNGNLPDIKIPPKCYSSTFETKVYKDRHEDRRPQRDSQKLGCLKKENMQSRDGLGAQNQENTSVVQTLNTVTTTAFENNETSNESRQLYREAAK